MQKPLPAFDKNKSMYLEFYRGVAALGVALFHYLSVQGSLAGEFTSTVFVEMFFPLSGFILAPQILKIYQERSSFGIFLSRRWIRTIPLYILGLLGIAVATHNTHFDDIAKYLFFYNFLSQHYSENNFYPISWSLAVEEFYYVLFPLFIFAVPIKDLYKKTLLFLGIFLAVKIGMAFFMPYSFIRIATYSRLDAIGIGFLIFLKKENYRKSILYITYPILAVACLAHYFLHNEVTLMLFIYVSNFCFAFTCAVLYNAEKEKVPTNRIFRAVASVIGSSSYSIYVFHIIVLGICVKAGLGIAAYLAITLMLAYIMHLYFEHPLMLMRPNYKQSVPAYAFT